MEVEEACFDGEDVGDGRLLAGMLRPKDSAYPVSLRRLSLVRCGINDSGGIALAESIGPNLVELVMTGNGLSDGAALALSRNLRRLERLGLGNNEVGATGARVLADKTLRELTLSGNRRMGDKGLMAVAEVLPKSTLMVLRLDACDCGSFRAASLLASALRVNRNLLTLSLSKNLFDDDGIIAISRALEHPHSSLRHLDLSDNIFGVQGAVAVGAALKHNEPFIR